MGCDRPAPGGRNGSYDLVKRMAIGFPATSTWTQHFDVDPIVMRQCVCDAFAKLGWEYEIVAGTQTAKIPMGAQSYGEILTVSVADDGSVVAHSRCVWPLQLMDWGKNRQNLGDFHVALLGSMRNSALDPRSEPAHFDESGESSLGRVIRDKN